MKNNNKSNNGANGGLGFCAVLTLIFITLKLCGVIEWSWLWVLAPLWIETALVLLVVAVAVTVAILKGRN